MPTQPAPTASEVVSRLQSMFAAQDAQMVAALAKAREEFEHGGNKGQAVEMAVREFLEGHLPRRYGVGCGEVIDRLGGRSGQLDAVILDSEQPFHRPRDTPGVYLAEGVVAIGEVKASLRAKDLDQIIERGPKIKALRPLPNKGDRIITTFQDRLRFVDSIPYFAIALETSMKPETILEKLNRAPEVRSHTAEVDIPSLDMLCVLNHGVYINLGELDGELGIRDDDGTPLRGWVGQIGAGGLVDLFAWLNVSLPRFERGASIAGPYFYDAAPDAT